MISDAHPPTPPARARRALAIVAGVIALVGPVAAAAQDTLRLGTLQQAAVRVDPRQARSELDARSLELRLGGLSSDRLPDFRLVAEGSVQSEVTTFPGAVVGASGIQPPKERYEAGIQVDVLVWDGGVLSARSGLERASYTVATAGLDAELFAVRTEVNEAYFGALLAQERLREAELLIEDLVARLSELRGRVEAGAALAGDTALVRAEMLEARQGRDGLAAERHAWLDVLGQLAGRRIVPDDVLVIPDLTEAVNGVGAGRAEVVASGVRVHPQYALFDAERARLDQQAAVTGATRLPRLSAFGQLAWGRPGFDQFDRDPHEYWRAGLQVRWAPWDWKRRSREMADLRVRQRMVDAEEASFTERLTRALQRPLRTMAEMRDALAIDDEIVVLREQVERQARAQFAERVISAAAYTEARNELQLARVARLRHRAELARAQAAYLTTLGVELR